MLLYHFGYKEGPRRRGKRLRPHLLMTVALQEGATLDDALDAAAAIEILHNYSLVHDDIEDRDRFRHGRETLWVRYGDAQAINAGDAMCALSYLTLARASDRHPAERVAMMLRRLHEANLAMCEGQSLDIGFETDERIDEAMYLRMIEGKTAALFAAACALGARCAGASERAVLEYYELGRSYGIAFQINDDVLGIWASAHATGKTAAADIVRKKKSFPIVWALAQSPSTARDAVLAAYRAKEPDDAAVAGVIRALDVLGARDAAHRAAAQHLSVVERTATGGVREFLLSSLPPIDRETVHR